MSFKELKMLMSFEEHQTSNKLWKTNVTFKPLTKTSEEVHIECSNGRPKAWSTAVKVGINVIILLLYTTGFVLSCLCATYIHASNTHLTGSNQKDTIYKWLYAQSSLKSELNMYIKIALMTVIHTILQHK